jgi:hypothetical protein
MAQKRTQKYFELWRQVPRNIDSFFEAIESGMRFRDACMALKVPYTLMYPLVHGDAALKLRYDALLAARADELARESLQIADETKTETEMAAVQAAKLRVTTRHWLAEKWDRDRYGDGGMSTGSAIAHGFAAALQRISERKRAQMLEAKEELPSLPELEIKQ